MRKLALIALLLAGCSTLEPRGPEVTSGSERAVTVNWARSNVGGMSLVKAPAGMMTDPAQIAENHCQQYKRHAQYAGKPNDFSAAYNCVD